MSIPRVAPYPLPRLEEIPASTASWRPDPDRAVLLIHDMQRYFVGFFGPENPTMATVVANIAALRAAAARRGIPVIYTAQPGDMTPSERGLLRDMWGPGMSSRPEHRDIIPELRPAAGDLVVTRWRPNAFVSTDLADQLRRRGRDQLVVCGIYAHVGCLLTAADAFCRDIEAFLVADAVADFSRDDHMMALIYAAKRCAVVLSTEGTTALWDTAELVARATG